MILVQPARIENAADIAALTTALGYASTPETTETHLAQLLASSRYCVLVAVSAEGLLVGWINAERRLTLESGESIEITGLVVAANARRQGVGRALVQAVQQWAQSQGFEKIRVRSNVAREASHAFYAGLGFCQNKTQHVYEQRF